MSRSIDLSHGLILSRYGVHFADGARAPAVAGPDISWLRHCRLGDNQGSNGACAIFACASWAEIVHGKAISDVECLAAYTQALADHGRDAGDGLTFEEAFEAASAAGWLPGASGLELVLDEARLAEQPLLAGYEVTPGWQNPNEAGCLDHAAGSKILGYHAVCIVARGELSGLTGGPFLYIENSWGRDWGWNGIGVMSDAFHQGAIRETWAIV
jgi:hypothetical protein